MTTFEPTLNQFLVFVLVLSRVSGLVIMLPLISSRSVPVRIRALLAAAMALLITPLHSSTPIDHPGNILNLGVILGREVALGLALGLGIVILFAGLQLTGQIIGQMSGMQLADAVSPNTDTTVPIFSQLLDSITLAVFFTIGGHRRVMQALLDTFAWMPPGQVRLSEDLLTALTDITSHSFILGVRAAAPMMIALLLSILIMGLISRTLPQLNVIAVGFSFNSIVMLATLSISLGAATLLFQEEADSAVDLIRDAIFPTADQ